MTVDLIAFERAGPRLFSNDGTARFTVSPASLSAPPHLQIALGPRTLLAGDLDGDGDIDIVISGTMQLLFNRQRQVHVPFAVRLGVPLPIELSAVPDQAPAAQFALPGLSLALLQPPLPIPPHGTWWLDPSVFLALPAALIPAPSGATPITLILPSQPSLLGRVLHIQVGFVHGPMPSQWRLSSFTSDVILP